MSDSAERLWLQDTLNQVAIKQALEATQKLGMALPCRVTAVSGSVVTVAFEVQSPWTLQPVTIPKAESQWVRAPTQIGDTGVTVPADVYLGGISGLGGGVANATRRGNLTTLQWLPCASASFPAVNTDAVYIAGPEGAVIQTQAGGSILNVGTAGVTITVGGKTWSFTAAGFTDSNGIVEETHIHSTPSGNSGPPEAG